MYWTNYPHQSRDSVSLVCGIFYQIFQDILFPLNPPLAGEGLWLWLLVEGTGDRWQVTWNMCYKTHNKWRMTHGIRHIPHFILFIYIFLFTCWYFFLLVLPYAHLKRCSVPRMQNFFERYRQCKLNIFVKIHFVIKHLLTISL